MRQGIAIYSRTALHSNCVAQAGFELAAILLPLAPSDGIALHGHSPLGNTS